MSTTMTTTAARIPSTFGMPAAGHAFGASFFRARGAECVLATSVVRGAGIGTGVGVIAAGTTGDAKGYVPGTPVWRPPSC